MKGKTAEGLFRSEQEKSDLRSQLQVVQSSFQLQSEKLKLASEQEKSNLRLEVQALQSSFDAKLQLKFDQWKQANEKDIRTDAAKRSRAVNIGKVSERFAPFFDQFRYNPDDAHFIGMPVDFIIFDGLHEGSLRQIVFLEVKTGAANLTPRQRNIQSAVHHKLVNFAVLRIPASAESVAIAESKVVSQYRPALKKVVIRFDPKLGQYVTN